MWDVTQQLWTDVDKSGHTQVFSDEPVPHLSAPDFMRFRYASEKPTDHINSDEKKVHLMLPDIGLAGTARVLIYAVDIYRNAIHPVKLVGDDCESGVYSRMMNLQSGKNISIKIGLSPVLSTNKDIAKCVRDRGEYLRNITKGELPKNASKNNKKLFCLKVEVQCPDKKTLVGYSNPVRDGKDGMEFKVFEYTENLSHTVGLVTMTKNSNFDDNIGSVVVLLMKKGSAENEKPIEVFMPNKIEKKTIVIKPISAYIKKTYPELEWSHFQIQVKDCVTGLKTVPHDLYVPTTSSTSPKPSCSPAKKIKTDHGINKEQKHKSQPCSDQARNALYQKMMCKSDAAKCQSVSEQDESSEDQQLTFSSNITNQPPKYNLGMLNISKSLPQADLGLSASQMDVFSSPTNRRTSAGSMKTQSSGVKKKKVSQKGIEEKREDVDIKKDKLCTSVAHYPNNAGIIPVSNTSEAIRDNMVQLKNLRVLGFSARLVNDRDISSRELMGMNGSQTHTQAQYDLEDYPMQLDTCQKPDHNMDVHGDEVGQQDCGQKTDQTIDDANQDADALEHGALQIDISNDDDQNQNEAKEDIEKDILSPTQMVEAVNNLIKFSKEISEYNIMDPNQKSPSSVFEDYMR